MDAAFPLHDDAPTAEAGDARTVSYLFPVEVLVVGPLGDDDRRLIEQRIWSQLATALAQSA